MREQDLVPAFLAELRKYDPEKAAELEASQPAYDSEEIGEYLNEELFDALNACAPSYCYFGAHEGDGSDYGFWLCRESIDQAVETGELKKISDMKELGTADEGEYLLVDSAGNSIGLFEVKRLVMAIWAAV